MAGKSTVLFPAFCGRGVKVEKNRTNDMTTGNPIKLIIMFMIPMFLGNIFQQFYNIVDSIVAGQFIGVDALAAIGSTGSLMFFVTGWLNGLSSGFGIIVAQMFGAKKYDDMRHFVAMSIYLMFGFAAAMTVGFLVFNVPILKLMNSPADLMGDVAGYMGIIYAGLLVTAAYNTLAAFLRALGDSKSPLYFLIISAGINVILDVALIRFVGMGVEGCAYATVIAQGVSAVCCLVYIKKKYPILHLEKKNFELRKGSMSKLLILGIPMGLQFSITAIGTIIVQSAVNIYGATHMAGFSAAGKIQNVIGMVAVSIAGIRPLVTAGIVLFSLAVLFQLVTLPVEINASSRALKMLQSTGILGTDETRGARKVLTAAAMTYVAALAASILQLLRLLILAGGRRRDD